MTPPFLRKDGECAGLSFNLKAIGEAFGVNVDRLATLLLSQWMRAGLLEKSGDVYVPTTAGMFWHEFLVTSLAKKLAKDASGLPPQAFESVFRPVEEGDRSRDS